MRTNRARYQLPFTWQLWVIVSSLLLGMLIAYTHPATALLPPFMLSIGIGLWLLWRHPSWGIYVLLLLAMSINTLIRGFPYLAFGVLVDGFVLLLTVQLLYKSYKEGNFWSAFDTPWSIPIGIWMGWHLICLFNPEAPSYIAWIYAMRPAVMQVFLFFVAYRYLRQNQQVHYMLYYLIGLSTACALWGIWQYIFGYLDFEMAHVLRHDARRLLYIQGRWRSFGTLGSPAHFGVLMASSAVMALMLSYKQQHIGLKILLWGSAALCTLGMVWSGTRAAYVVLPLSIGIITLLSGNRRLILLCALLGSLLLMVGLWPSQNYHIRRIQTIFNREQDASYLVRMQNQEAIRPYILSHPMGGGIGTTGVWGKRFSPEHFLSTFPPDSGYVRIAVESGWIGLCCYLLLWGSLLWIGLRGYFNQSDPERRWMVLTLLVALIPLLAVETGQDIVGKLPSSLLFWLMAAMLLRMGKNEHSSSQS